MENEYNKNFQILIVDDIPENIQVLGNTLREQGYSLSFATDGKQAIKLASMSMFDLILLDIMMPEMDGFEVCKHFKNNSITKEIPIMFLTAKTNIESIMQGFEVGAVDYIQKPFHPAEVLARVKTQLALKRSRENLQESEAKYRRLLEGTSDIIYSFSEKKKEFYVSSRVEKILGYKSSDFHKNPFLWFDLIHPDDIEKYNNILKSLQKNKKSEVEYRIKDANGEWLWLSDKSIVNKIENNDTIIEGIATNITDRKKREEEMLKIVKLESAGIFAGGIAHDFNNLNAAILGYIELTKEKIKFNEELYQLLSEAKSGLLKSKDLIKYLLNLSKGIRPSKKIGNIEKTIQEAISLALGDSTSMVSFSSDDKIWKVEFDETQIKNVIYNILLNAKEAMPKEGEIKINIKNIEIFGEEKSPILPGKYIEISIKDQGIGIPEKDIQIIFDPYYSTKKRYSQKGLGLGLSTSFSIIKKHNGYISVDSKVGEGSIFYIYLPLNNNHKEE
ncbi:MAG: response regulator [Desulfobacterales bacterium]|nr:response regulator [Desulfobacterales bacterium]